MKEALYVYTSHIIFAEANNISELESYNKKINDEKNWTQNNNYDLNNIEDQNLIKTGQEILLRNEKDIHFIGDDNFIAITKYNRSHFYAKAVYDLSLEF